MKLKPIGSNLVVKQKKEKEKTDGGLYIPTTVQDKPLEGEVLAVGDGWHTDSGTLVKLSVKKGDIVMFTKNAYIEVKMDGEDYLIIREDNILAVIEQ